MTSATTVNKTTVATETDYNLPWDAFLDGSVAGNEYDDLSRPKYIASLRLMIDRFRQVEWPAIVRHLRTDHQTVVPEGLEPHWVAPNRAVLWQMQYTRGKEAGWKPMTPQRIGSAAELVRHLTKGLRLRPPIDGVDVEVLEANALPLESSQGEPENVPTYSCGNRHPSGSDRVGGPPRSYKTWKSYVRHCIRYQDPITETPPENIRLVLAERPFFCPMCARGFRSARSAAHHYKAETRRLKRRDHISPQKMAEAASMLRGEPNG